MIVELTSISRAMYIHGKRYDIHRLHNFKKEFADVNALIDFLIRNKHICLSESTWKQMRRDGTWKSFVQKWNYVAETPDIYGKIAGTI